MKSLFPEEFRDLPRDCVERIWDTLLDVGSGIYLSREEFDRVFGVVDKEVKIFSDSNPQSDTTNSFSSWKTRPLESDALQKLFVLFELPSNAGWVDGFEILGAIILASNQLSRREKLLMIRDRCLLFSPLNVASVINGASLALENRRVLVSEEERLRCHAKNIESYADKFAHKKIPIRVEISKTGYDVIEQNLKISVGGKISSFAKDGTTEVYAESGSRATIGSWELKLKTGTYTLKGKTEFDQALVKVLELDGLNEKGDADDASASDDEEDRQFRLQAELEGDEEDEKRSVSDTEDNYVSSTTNETRSQVESFDEYLLEWNYGIDNWCGAKQIASGEIIYVAGRFAIVEDLLGVKTSASSKSPNRRIWPMHNGRITALEVHPNGRWIFSAEEGSNKILVWDSQKMQLLGSVDAVVSGAKNICLSKCGSTLFLYSNRERVYCFYDASRADAVSLVYSDRLPKYITVNKAQMMSKDEVVLVGSDVVRMVVDGSMVRMRWGKTAPKGDQDSLAVLYGSRSIVTASSEMGTIYLWVNDCCTKHITFADLKVHSLSICHGNGPNSIACGLSDGTIQLITARNLELTGSTKATLVNETTSSANFKTDGNNREDDTSSTAMKPPLPPPVASLVDGNPNHREKLVSIHCGLSGLLVGSSNGSLFWYSFKPTQEDPWTLLKVGHGGTRQLKWCWCGPDLVASAGDDKQLRVWKLNRKDTDLSQPKHGLVVSKSGLRSKVTAIAGDRSRLFVALEGRQIQAADIRTTSVSHAHLSIYDPIDCSLPLIDRLAATDNLIAACCTKARTIEIRAFPSGKLVSKLRFDSSLVRLENETLRFTETERGEMVLVYGNVFAWDIKTWSRCDIEKSKLKDDAHAFLPCAVGSCLLLYNKCKAVDDEGGSNSATMKVPVFNTVCCIPSASSGKPQEKRYVAVNGKGVRAVAVHRDWSKGTYAIGTDQPYIQVHEYKLNLDSPARSVAFNSGSLMSACTETRIYLFDWCCGVLLASSKLPSASSTTLGLAVGQTNALDSSFAQTFSQSGTPHAREQMDVLLRVDGNGDIQVWRREQDKLTLIPSMGLTGAKATCITPSGFYGTSEGKIHNILTGKTDVGEHHGGVNDLFEDKLGFLSAGQDGTLRSWTTMMQHVPMRKDDKVKYSCGIVGVHRCPIDNQVVVRTSDGSVYANNELVPSQDINKGVTLAKLRQFRYVPSAIGNKSKSSSSSSEDRKGTEKVLFLFENYAKRKVYVCKQNIYVNNRQSESKFQFDDDVKLAAISGSKKYIAVASICDDVYILDANTCNLLYFWPNSHVGCTVETLKFTDPTSRGYTESNLNSLISHPKSSAAGKDDLFVNGERFLYKF